jgi:tetratricopeptide (TPR) repeat protein
MPLRLGKAGKATALNELGRQRDEEGDQDGALQAYLQAGQAHPQWAVPWFNAGLIHKYRGDWAASLATNAEAVRRDPGNEGALWNLGIAATALGDWPTARRAWQRYGIGVPDGDGPVEFFVGLTPIRVHGDEASEVIWSDRIDPARAILRNVPTPACGHRYGDLVLHDGAANGYRLRGEREVPVFDALELIAPSAFSTFEVSVEDATKEDIDLLIKRFEAAGGHEAAQLLPLLRFLPRAHRAGAEGPAVRLRAGAPGEGRAQAGAVRRSVSADRPGADAGAR